ncbi:MAG: winged helix-turn-helix domain-containing protein [Candidatus Woesearchaeota archaeon]
MADESFILVNLKDKESKSLAQVISNDTSRKILDILSVKHDATATDIANELNQPLSTIHYNLKHLLEAKLIQSDEYHYSPKGKEVDHYKLSNKFVIIAPQSSKFESLKDQLKKIIPVTLLIGAGVTIMSYANRFALGASQSISAADERLMTAAPEMLKAAPSATLDTTQVAANEVVTETVSYASECVQCAEPNLSLYFFIGSVSALLLYLLIDQIYRRIE